MTTLRIAAMAALLLPAAVCALQEAPRGSASPDEAAATITAEDFGRRIGVIAHDSMKGRDTPSSGLDATAAWIASQMEGLGLRGGAPEGGFVQRYPVRSIVVDRQESRVTLGGETLAFGVDVLPLRGVSGSGEATAGLVLVSGSGFAAPSVLDRVRDRHVVLLTGLGRSPMNRAVFQLVATVANAGARSVTVTTDAADADWAGEVSDAFAPSVEAGWNDPDAQPPFRPVLHVRVSALERALAGHGVDIAALRAREQERVRADIVDGVEVTVALTLRVDEVAAPNVVAVLEGSDPALRDEYVVLSAHMDHVGVGTPDERGDSIFNGADDDASGTVAVMEVAEAMASLETRPARSTIFLWVSGEERGLWGSEWYADHPTVPVDRLVANLNADMVGRNWPDTIVAIGKEHSDLGATLERVNAAHREIGMTAIDDLWPDEQFYFRSDHFNFARKGVPILFFFNGTHDDYHGRDDEPDRIDTEKAARIAKLLYWLGLEVANAAERPVWNPESRARIVSDR